MKEISTWDRWQKALDGIESRRFIADEEFKKAIVVMREEKGLKWSEIYEKVMEVIPDFPFTERWITRHYIAEKWHLR